MLTYSEYEKTVFEWLMAKHEKNSNFTFTVRQSAGNGSETDYFIGTSKSNYFATSFWTLPISFPGSSADCINLIFQLSKAGYSYYFEFNQTNTPQDSQNQSALNLIKALKSPLEKKFTFKKPVQEANKMYNIQISALEKVYGNLDFMFADIDKQLDDIILVTDIEIERETKINPQFKANRVTEKDFNDLILKLNKRIEKHDNVFDKILADLGNQTTKVYISVLRRLLKDLDVQVNSEKIYFNYEKKSLIFGIGQRYVFNIEANKFFRLISKNMILESGEEFKAEPKAYLNNYPLDYDIELNYDELLLGAKETLAVTEKSGFYKFDKKDFRNMAFDIVHESGGDSLPDTVIKFPKNQILYGPPGTGKTYHTINKALAIIENKSEAVINLESRSDLLKRFDGYIEKGQIVFTTFHQSLSYEDFIEGIKPEIEEDKEGVRAVVYDIKDGIFKAICNQSSSVSLKQNNEQVYHFDDAWNQLLATVQSHLESQSDFVLDILTPKKGLKVTEVTNNGNLRLTPISMAGLDYTVSYARLKELQKAFPNLSKVRNIDKEFRSVIGGMNSTAYWATLNFVNNWLENSNGKKRVNLHIPKLEPYVLIIDEINRGNVSAIFGELITCIEDSKRLGNEEALKVTLPYSKTSFGVPNNVYLIGTMNTADRSVEALDTALRRRFSFVEMLPDSSLLSPEKMVWDLWWKHENEVDWTGEPWNTEEKNIYNLMDAQKLHSLSIIEKEKLWLKIEAGADETVFSGLMDDVTLNFKEVLDKINRRLEKLLSRDHTIGHSFFLGIITENDLYNAFYNKIVPLLQEYFFGDYGKIGLVLGATFVEEVKRSDSTFFADFIYEDKDLLLEKKVYRINKFTNDINAFIRAVKAI